MKSLKKVLAVLLTSVFVFCQFPISQSASAESAGEKKRIIVSLGDSYSSGEGIEPFYGQENILSKILNSRMGIEPDIQDWLSHRSKLCWSGQLELADLRMSEHRNENWFFVAVSGAEIKNLGVDKEYLKQVNQIIDKKAKAQTGHKVNETLEKLNIESLKYRLNDKGEVIDVWEEEKQKKTVSIDRRGNEWRYKTFELPFQLDVFNNIEKDNVDYVTLTLSGNDIGFSNIIEEAIKVSTIMSINNLTKLLEGKIELFDAKVRYYLYAAYAAIQDKAGKQAKIIVAGYPKLLNEDGSTLFSPLASQQVDKYASMFNKRIEEIINDCRVYGGMNIYFVPVEGDEYFGGHEAGTKNPYINHLKLLQPQDLDKSAFPPVSAYSIHPNKKGAEAYADAVQKKINELEDNGIISGFIYENCENNPKDISSKIKNITFINIETNEMKTIYTNKNNTPKYNGELSYDPKKEWMWKQFESRLLLDYDEDTISKSGYYEIVVPPGRYKLEITCTDGTSFFLNNEEADNNSATENYAVIEIEARDVLKNQNIYLEDKLLVSDIPVEYEWYLEPSIDAEDIIVSDDSFDTFNCMEKFGNKNTDTYSYIQKDGKFCMIDYTGKLINNNWYSNAAISEIQDMGLHNWDADIGTPEYNTGVWLTTAGEYQETALWLERGGYQNYYLLYDKDTQKIYEHESPGDINISSNKNGILLKNAKVIKNEYGYYNYDETADGKYGAGYNLSVTIPFEYDNGIMSYYNNMIALEKNGKWGYFNAKTGVQVIDFIELSEKMDYYDNLSHFGLEKRPFTYSDGYLALETDAGWAYYDENGNEIIPAGTFEEIRPVHNGLAWVKDTETGLWGVIKLPELSDENATNAEKETDSLDISDWRTAYTEILNNTEYKYFSLLYIDDNEIPELVLHMTTGDTIKQDRDIRLYTFYDNQAVDLGTYFYNGYNNFAYYERKGKILNATHGSGVETGTIYMLSDGKLEIQDEYVSSASFSVPSVWNGESFTADEIYALIDGYTLDYGDYEINAENIAKYLAADSIENEQKTDAATAEEGVTYKGTRNEYGLEYFTMIFDKSENCFYVAITDEYNSESGFDLPVSDYQNGVYTYTNGESYYRNSISYGRIPVASGLSGTLEVKTDGQIVWHNNASDNVGEFTIDLIK